MNNIGILGGTFNPIHLGHTLPAKAVATYLSLDKVLLIPANIPPHKNTPNISATQRAAMVKLACDDDPLFVCDERELSRQGYSYTVDTLKELTLSYPNARLYFIMGLDSLHTFTSWHKYKEILSLCHLVVNTRPNYQLSTINQATQLLLKQHRVDDINTLRNMNSGGIFLLPNNLTTKVTTEENQLNIDISSSEIRQGLPLQQNYNHLLSPKVLAFIDKNQLYR